VPADHWSEREILRSALTRGKDCVPIEQLEMCLEGDAAPQELLRHVESCAHCSTELELLRSFDRAPGPEEAEAVREIVGRLRLPRPMASASDPWWRGLLRMRLLSPAAVAMAGILIAIAVGVEWRQSGAPQLHAPKQAEEEILRSGSIQLTAPAGDIQTVPTRIEWQPTANAAQYRVSLLEVDHSEIWSASTHDSQIDIPEPARAAIVPAKTLLIHVVALDGSGRQLAESAFVRLRLLQEVYKR